MNSEPLLKPYRYSIDWVAADTELDNAEGIFEAVYEFIVEQGGFVEGGIVQRMPDEDVVPGSPLARALDNGAERSPSAERAEPELTQASAGRSSGEAAQTRKGSVI